MSEITVCGHSNDCVSRQLANGQFHTQFHSQLVFNLAVIYMTLIGKNN